MNSEDFNKPPRPLEVMSGVYGYSVTDVERWLKVKQIEFSKDPPIKQNKDD